MNPPVFVVDTHALVWFSKGHFRLFGPKALSVMLSNHTRIVIPSFAFIEVQYKFSPKMDGKKNSMRVPPTPLLRLVCNCKNVRILPRSPAVLSWEFKLARGKSSNGISDQDIPIAAATIVARECYEGQVSLITKDGTLKQWATSEGISVIW